MAKNDSTNDLRDVLHRIACDAQVIVRLLPQI